MSDAQEGRILTTNCARHFRCVAVDAPLLEKRTPEAWAVELKATIASRKSRHG